MKLTPEQEHIIDILADDLLRKAGILMPDGSMRVESLMPTLMLRRVRISNPYAPWPACGLMRIMKRLPSIIYKHAMEC